MHGSDLNAEMKKKLIEVALPLEAINEASRKEKSPFTKNHPRALHVWWARRPLVACRAVLFASLVDDPSSNPDQYPTEETQIAERHRLFRLIERLVRWENNANQSLLKEVGAEIKKYTAGAIPCIFDPFGGGGSIPIEAQRLGIDARSSDLNPVAVLINKALIEIPPKLVDREPVGPSAGILSSLPKNRGIEGLLRDIDHYSEWLWLEARKRIGHLYPRVTLPQQLGSSQSPVTAWIWARIVTCPNPACGGAAPLVRSFDLSTKPGNKVWISVTVDNAAKRCTFTVEKNGSGARASTVGKRGATCLICNSPISLDYIRLEGKAGRIGTQLLAIVTSIGKRRIYVSPTPEQQDAARIETPGDAPDSELPEHALGFRVQAYGVRKHMQLFSSRQLTAMVALSDLVMEARDQAMKDGADLSYANAIATYLGIAVSRFADFSNAFCSWDSGNTNMRQLFARQTISMAWDFAETNPLEGVVSIKDAAQWAITALRGVRPITPAQVLQRDAAAPVESDRPLIVCTDPPYYDNIGYADLSDFFYVWLRRALHTVYPELFSTLLTPKRQELIADPHRFEEGKKAAQHFFEDGLGKTFAEMYKVQDRRFPMTVFYAFKQSDSEENEEDGGNTTVSSTGWETMLEGLLSASFQITGTWPMRTEQQQRSRSLGSNALASSIILVCRPRPTSAPITTRKDFLARLKRDMPHSLKEMQQGNIAPVDLAQAAIGPGMAVFSEYTRVLESDGSPMRVRTALALINQTLDEVLSEQESEFDPDTRWALAWFDQYAFEEGPYGQAEVLATAKALSVSALDETNILRSRAGKVRLLRRDELSADWNPTAEHRLTVWAVTQQLIRSLDKNGETATATLASKVGGLAETARDLAYRLYVLCERKGWAEEAGYYNSLVVSWPAIAPKAFALS